MATKEWLINKGGACNSVILTICTQEYFRGPNQIKSIKSGSVMMEIVDTHFHLWTAKTHPWIVKVKDGGHPAGKFGKHFAK